MNKIQCLSLAALCLGSVALAEPPPLPPVVARYEQILVKSPEKGTAFDKVYQHFFENEGLDKLAERWRSEAQKSPKDAEPYQLLLGLLYERQGAFAEARKALTEATKLAPNDFRASKALGDLEAGDGKLLAAIAAFEKALAANPPANERAALFRQLARSQQRNLDAAGALATWEKMAAEFPKDPFVIEEVAEAQLEAEKFEEAKKTFTKLRDLAGTDPFKKVTATIRLAQVEERQGKTKEALAIYESALPQASENSWIHRDVRSRIEEVYRRQDDLPGLVSYYEKWLGAHDKDVEAATRISSALVELNRKKEAITWIQKAVSWAPDRRELQVELAKMLRDTDQVEAAQKLLATLTQSFPDEVSYWEMLGDTEWMLFKKTNDAKHKQAAIDSWRKLAPKETKDASSVSRFADILSEKGLEPEALEQFERASTMAPDASDLRERWANYLFQLKKEDAAWKVLDALVIGERANAANYQRLATLQLKWGKLDAALESVKKGLALAPAEYSLLALQWRIHSERKEWDAAAALYPQMLAASPAMAEQTEQQYLQALKAADKLESEQKNLAAKIPTANEGELRLLARMALQSEDLPGARAALDEGKKRFPTSFTLALLESEYAKHSGNLESRVAALRALIKLEPKQASDFLQQIARAYQEHLQWDQSLDAAQEWITASPANADAYSFYADISFAAGKNEQGIEKLRDAIRLSEKPNQIRQRLAQAYGQVGEIGKATQVAQEAFESEQDPSAKIGALRMLSECYFQQGKIDSLINQFRERQRNEEGGWRYAIYLSEIFQQMQDYAQAREELAKSLASRPKDPGLLKQLIRLAEQEDNSAQLVRFYKALAEVEPSTANHASLAEALADSGDCAGAIQVLVANETEVLKDPAPWRLALAKVQKEGAAATLNTALQEALRRRPDDFSGRMTLAEIQIAMGNVQAAAQTLWDIRRMPKPAQSQPAVSTPPPGFPPFFPQSSMFSGPGGKIVQRTYMANQAQESFAELVDSGRSSNPYNRRRYYGRRYYGIYGMMTGQSTSAASFEQTQDKALVYLASIALRQSKIEDFLADLQKQLSSQNADRTERLLAYSLVQSQDLIWKEIQAEADSPTPNSELDEFCLSIASNLSSGSPADQPAEASKAADLIDKLSAKIAKANPKKTLELSMARVWNLNRAGKKEEAKKLIPDLLAQVDPNDSAQVGYGISLAIEAGELQKAEDYLRKATELAKKKNNSNANFRYYKSSLAQLYLKNNDAKNAARLYAESFLDSLPTKPGAKPMGRGFYFGYRSYYRGGYSTQFPGPNRFIDDQMLSELRQAHAALKPAKAVDALIETLSKAEVPAGTQIYPQLAVVYLQWFDDKKPEALKSAQAVLAANNDDELRLAVASMQAELDQGPAAIALLEQIAPTQRDLYKQAQRVILIQAKKAKDNEAARKAMLRLLAMRPQRDELDQLLPDVKSLGLSEKAEQIEKQIATTGSGRNEMYEKANLLNTYCNEKKQTEALGLAKSILALDPFGNQSNLDYARDRALSALEMFKALDAYIADLEKQAAAAPDSVRVTALLAEAWTKKDTKKGVEWYTKVIALRPNDLHLKSKLIRNLVNRRYQNQKDQGDEGFKLCSEILASDESLLFDQEFGSLIVNAYAQSKKLPDLAAIVLKQAPRPQSLSPNYGDRTGYICIELSDRLPSDPQNQELAVKVLQKAIALQSSSNPNEIFELRNKAARGLVKLGRKEEALSVIEAGFFPAAAPKPVLLGNSSRYNTQWMYSMSYYASGEILCPAMASLHTAQQLGGLDALRKKAEAKANENDEAMKCLVVAIRVLQRDPKLLEELPKISSEGTPGYPGSGMGNTGFLRLISDELSSWPQAQKLSIDILQNAKKNIPSGDIFQSFGVRLQLLNRCLALGDAAQAQSAAKDTAEVMAMFGTQNYFDSDAVLIPIRSMVRLGLEKEAQQFIDFVKSRPARSYQSELSRQLPMLESELALAKGSKEASAKACVYSIGKENGKDTIAWEIQTSSAGDGFVGQDFAKLDGRWDLEIIGIAAPNCAQRIAWIPKAKSRGKWSGTLPSGMLSLQAVLHPAGSKKPDAISLISSKTTQALIAPNLWVNPGFDGLGSPAAQGIKGYDRVPQGAIQPGGPRPGGSFVALQASQDDADYLRGEKIPVQKGKEYFLSGWERCPGNRSWGGFGVQYLDADQKDVGNAEFSQRDALGTWTYSSQALSFENQNGKRRIPEKTAYLRPFVRMNGNGFVEFDGLFLGEINSGSAPAKNQPLPAALATGTITSPFALACPVGEENGKQVVRWEVQEFKQEGHPGQVFAGRSDTKLDGHFDLELLYTGTGPAQRLALIPDAKTTGKWAGNLPPGTGTLEALLHPSKKKGASAAIYTGMKVPVTLAPNLIANANFEVQSPKPPAAQATGAAANPIASSGSNPAASAAAATTAPLNTVGTLAPSTTGTLAAALTGTTAPVLTGSLAATGSASKPIASGSAALAGGSTAPVLPVPSILFKGWDNSEKVKITRQPGGPRPNGTQIAFNLPEKKGVAIYGEKIPLNKERQIILSVWMQTLGNGTPARIGMRYFDKNGKEVGSDWLTTIRLNGKWQRQSTTVSTASKGPGRKINSAAVSVQPVIDVRDDVALDGIFLGETLPTP